jgi:hypothetical protein
MSYKQSCQAAFRGVARKATNEGEAMVCRRSSRRLLRKLHRLEEARAAFEAASSRWQRARTGFAAAACRGSGRRDDVVMIWDACSAATESRHPCPHGRQVLFCRWFDPWLRLQ